MQNALHFKIDIKLGLIEVLYGRKLDMEDLSDRRIPEPGKLVVRQEDFPVTKQQTEAVLGYVCDFDRVDSCLSFQYPKTCSRAKAQSSPRDSKT
jgi:hypothetical protein